MKLIISILIPIIIGGVGGFFSSSEITSWYAQLNKPWFNPPSWIFAPVWTTLYILMGIAMYLIWKSNAPEPTKKAALYLYAIQLVLNFFWSIIFFNLHQTGWALVEIGCMWLFILLTIFAFAKINNTAAWLLVPYITWVSFASILNFEIWRLNS